MNIKGILQVSGEIKILEVLDKNGNVKSRVENIKNLILNAAISTSGYVNPVTGPAYLHESAVENYEDLDGTWNQTGNTVTRATGTGTFPTSPSQVGNEFKWGTGERCHVTARTSDTVITVSGPARTITGGTIRRYSTNGIGTSATTGFKQTIASPTSHVYAWDKTTGIGTSTSTYNFASATVAYVLASVFVSESRVKLPAPVSVSVDDQVRLTFVRTETISNRSQTYDMGAEATGLPQKYSMTTIVGSGSNVDVTFSGATHFLAGDKLDLRNVTPKKFAISSASSTSTTFTINTAAAHGLSPGDSVTIENASLAGYNGVFTAATASGTVLTITNAANPGGMGAFGTVRLTTPTTYFDDLGLATIASMVSSSVARITSGITGVAVDPGLIGGDPGVTVVFAHPASSAPTAPLNTFPTWSTGSSNSGAGNAYYHTEANAQAVWSAANNTAIAAGTSAQAPSSSANTNAAYTNDWTRSTSYTLNTGSPITRLKQFKNATSIQSSCHGMQITWNTPIDFLTTLRLVITGSIQVLRTLP